MELIILGSGTCVPSLKRGSPGLIIKAGGEFLLFDSGSGTIRRMLEAGITYNDIDYIFYSHIHPDHVADLVPFLFASKYADMPREKNLDITGGRGFKKFFKKLNGVYGRWLESELYKINVRKISNKTVEFDNFKITAKPLAHSKESTGYRVEAENGKTIVFSGDTDYCKNIVELGRNADIFILECSLPDEKRVAGHLTPSLCGKIAAESKCKKLVLTHFYPSCDTVDIAGMCRKYYKGEIALAEDLMKIVV
ncbi:MAG: ribonuclease Z [Nitrospinae bacterium]|nr:ribonuclease Z [Nitrospinota bacterium]MBI3814836.1 ribonuclease Z [Nitrospinota bacterium]